MILISNSPVDKVAELYANAMTDPTTKDDAVTTAEETEFPYRLADAQNHGWLGDGHGRYRGYDIASDFGDRTLADRPMADVEAEFGPTRPVLPMLTADADELRAAFTLAGRKLVTSLASALEVVHFEARERFGPWDSDTRATAAYAQRTLTAGRPGSWEAEGIMPIVYFGNELNLWPNKASVSVEAMRKTGPNSRRVHIEARDQMAAVLRRWVASDERYTEVAENLAYLVSSFADDQHGDQGWAKIADQWLQPAGLATENFRACYRILYSLSGHLNTDYV